MADAGTMFRSLPTPTPGKYNRAVKVASNTTVAFTGSMGYGAAVLVQNASNVVLTPIQGGPIAAAALTAGQVYEIGVSKVTNGGTGVVYVLQKQR